MVDYPTSKADKALAQRANTSAAKPPWRELLDRYDAAPSSKTSVPDVLQGFSGSWAAQYSLGDGVQSQSKALGPSPARRMTNRLGLPGLGEINFRPYDYGTNRHGKYGPSLLGHPISFRVIGPTAKSDHALHQWWVEETADNDILHLDSVTWRSTVGVPEALPATMDDILEIYGIEGVLDTGLYLVVSLTGSEGLVDDNGAAGTRGGVGDGLIGDDGTPPILGQDRAAIVPKTADSKFEVFRVVDVGEDSLTLDTSKRLADYFDFDSDTESPIIRSVTLVTPAATRVVAVPGTGTKGKETVFAVVPPAASLGSDMQPPLYVWTDQGLFDPWISGPARNVALATVSKGDSDLYSQRVALPIPMPIAYGKGHIQGKGAETPDDLPIGHFVLQVDAASPHFDSAEDAGKILCIRDIRVVGEGALPSVDSDGSPIEGETPVDRLLGYFEIIDTDAGGTYTVRALSQFDPETGVGFWFSSRLMRLATGVAAGSSIELEWTLHEPVSRLWTTKHLNLASLASARLTNIIDPKWVSPSIKGRFDNVGSPHLPDRAVFDTSSSSGGDDGTNANPGSLLDLGFRMVLFPAKPDGGVGDLIPDFDHPVDSNDLILDPDVTEKQFVTIDYSSGLIELSHPMGVGGDLLRNADVLTASDNFREEATFFVSCVPFSLEPGQMGGFRVVGGGSSNRDSAFCSVDEVESADVYGGRLFWPVADSTITCATHETIKLDTALSPTELPPSGFVDLVWGDRNPYGEPLFANGDEQRLSTFGYSSVLYVDPGNGGNTTLLHTFGGADQLGPATADVEGGVTPATVVLRREVTTPNTSDGVAGTPYQYDTTYGYAKRTPVVRFKHSVVEVESDGSVSVEPRSPYVESHTALFDELFSSWLLWGGEQQATLRVDFVLKFSEMAVLIAGVRTVIPATAVEVNNAPDENKYIYINGEDPSCPSFAFSDELPLPNENDVLLGRYTTDNGNTFVESYTDLRHPLSDVDKRVDITVGEFTGHPQPLTAHFNTLGDAVQYVAEVSRVANIGQYQKIRVVGPTTEIVENLPISHPGLNGLIIEGSANLINDDATVSWWGDAPALFDLSGCSGWVIRDVAFKYDVGDGSATSATVEDRTFAIVTTDAMSDMVFENIRLYGDCHGFLWVDDSSNPGNASCDRVTLRNVNAGELTDFAVRIESNVETPSSVLIENCTFVVEKGATQQCGLDGGVIHLAGSTATQMRVRNNVLTGGYVGVQMAGATASSVENCSITVTDQAGVYVESGEVTLRGNRLLSVHTQAASIHSSKVGVLVADGEDHQIIVDNTISLSGASSGDSAIYAAGAGTDYCVFRGNYLGGDLNTAEYCTIDGNDISSDLYPGSYSSVSGNKVAGLLAGANGDRVAYSNNQFTQHDGTNHEIGDHCTCSGDTFGDPDSGSAGGRLTLGNYGLYTNCFFEGGVEGSNKQSNRVENSRLSYRADATVLGDSNVFHHNWFSGRGAGYTLTFDGVGLVFSGNTTTSIDTAVFKDTAASSSQLFEITGNIVNQSGGLGGMWVVGNGCVVSNNRVDGYEAESADPNTWGIYYSGVKSSINGNVLSQGLRVDGSGNSATGNRVYTMRAAASTSTFSGNHVQSTSTWDGDYNVVGDSTFTGATTLSGEALSVLGCYFTDDVTASSESLSFKNNYVSGEMQIAGGVGVQQSFTGNHFSGLFYFNVGESLKNAVITGNYFGEEVNFGTAATGIDTVVDSTITGNTFASIVVMVRGSRSTFSSNRVEGDCDFTSGDRIVVNNNWFADPSGVDVDVDLRSSNDYICIGNYVTGDLYISAGAGSITGGIVMGNRAALIGDGAAGAAPTNYQVTLGNKVDNGAGGTVYGVNPATTTVNSNNISDDS